MESVVGIFVSRVDARRAFERIRSIGVMEEHLSLFMPGDIEEDIKNLPTEEPEPGIKDPGIGKVMGSVIGGASGLALGPAATAAVAALIPGVGPILAIGIAASAILGLGGGYAGAKIGERSDDSSEVGFPRDEVFLYEEALRQGRCVVVAFVNGSELAARTRAILDEEGAEAVDVARKRWWLGIRDTEQEHYEGTGARFAADEAEYQKGFEAALHLSARGRSYEEAHDYLARAYSAEVDHAAFREGYDRGHEHFEQLRARYDTRTSDANLGESRSFGLASGNGSGL